MTPTQSVRARSFPLASVIRRGRAIAALTAIAITVGCGAEGSTAPTPKPTDPVSLAGTWTVTDTATGFTFALVATDSAMPASRDPSSARVGYAVGPAVVHWGSRSTPVTFRCTMDRMVSLAELPQAAVLVECFSSDDAEAMITFAALDAPVTSVSPLSAYGSYIDGAGNELGYSLPWDVVLRKQ